MTPLFACFPVCMTFAVLALIAVVVIVFDLSNRIPGDDQPAAAPTTPADPNRKMGPPPWWVFPLMLLAVILSTLLAAWIWPE